MSEPSFGTFYAMRVKQPFAVGLDAISAIDADALLPGDIIFSTTTHHVSWLIRAATNSIVSHAAIHIGSGIAIEANDPGVVPVFLPVLGFENAARLVVKRMPGLSEKERAAVVGRAMDLLYRPYSTKAAVASIVPWLREENDPGKFCSQLVAHCYEQIGHSLCDKPSYSCSPEDLYTSLRLETVAEGVRQVDREVHAVAVSAYADLYVAYLVSGPSLERSLVRHVEEALPTQGKGKSFNIQDLIHHYVMDERQGESASLADEVIFACTAMAVKEFPLTPCPGVAVATCFGMAIPTIDPGSPIIKEILMESQRLSLWAIKAQKWELDTWMKEAERYLDLHKETDLKSWIGLANWIGNTVRVRHNYSRLLAAHLYPADRISKIKEELRAMVEKDPIGAKEFPLDIWRLLDQEVYPLDLS